MVIIILEREKHALKVNIKSIVIFVIECTFYEKILLKNIENPHREMGNYRATITNSDIK